MRTVHNLLINLLVGVNIFILFFLLFEDRMVIPAWVQILGRTHPLILHFPIVLLTLVWLLATFGNRLDLPRPTIHRLVHVLLLATAWGTALTVVAGLVLSKESGYGDGDGLRWHKWTGVALNFLAAGLLLYYGKRKGTVQGRRLVTVGLTVGLVFLLSAGHFGAELTHGTDYLLEPVRKVQRRSFDPATAVVYADLVYPILEARCLSCHQPGKAKGGLVLSDTASLLKGGDAGPALVRGGESLLIERLLLDPAHEHHMPPKGKPQLTDGELALIREWVAKGADFTVPLSAWSSADTLYQLAITVYGPPSAAPYDFPAADPKTVTRLNTPYRVVRPLAHDSPALTVNFYGKAAYTTQALSELAPVGRQVVSLNLSGLPLTMGDRDLLTTFVNLRELLLNDTPVDDTWADALVSLPALRVLSLSSTPITADGLDRILSAPALRTVYSWNTAVGADDLNALQQRHRHVRLEQGFTDDGSTILPLNDPQLLPASTFFRDSVQVTLSHPVSGVELRYTLDGNEPDSLQAPVYRNSFILRDDAVVRVKGYKTGWQSSREVRRVYHRTAPVTGRIHLLNRPHPRYRGREAHLLDDLESGSDNYADGKWLGYHGQSMEASVHFAADTRVDTLCFSVMQAYGSHIYPPAEIRVWGGVDSAGAKLLARLRTHLDRPEEAAQRRLIHVPVRSSGLRYLRLEAAPYQPIPQSYPGAGNPAWIFIDELLFR